MQRGVRAKQWTFFALAVAGGLCPGPSAEAMRYVEFNISVDKKLVLRTSVGDSGHEDASTVWRYLKRLPLRTMNGYRVRPDPGRPQQATLKGKVQIVPHVGNVVALDRLRLVRSTEDGKWRLAPEEVERAYRERSSMGGTNTHIRKPSDRGPGRSR